MCAGGTAQLEPARRGLFAARVSPADECVIIRVHTPVPTPTPPACFPTSPEINAPWGSWARNTHLWAFRIVSASGEGSRDVVGGGTGSLSWAGGSYCVTPAGGVAVGKVLGPLFTVLTLDSGWIEGTWFPQSYPPISGAFLCTHPHLLFLLPSIWQALTYSQAPWSLRRSKVGKVSVEETRLPFSLGHQIPFLRPRLLMSPCRSLPSFPEHL